MEWVAISFSNAWKWKVKVKSLSRVRPSATPWTAAFQAPPPMGFSRQEYWSGVSLPSLGKTAYQSSNTPHKFILLLKCVTLLQGLSFTFRSSKFLSSIQNPSPEGFPGGLKWLGFGLSLPWPGSGNWDPTSRTTQPKKQKQTNRKKSQSKINFDEYHISPLKERSGSSCVPFHGPTVLWSSIVLCLHHLLPIVFHMFLESRNLSTLWTLHTGTGLF